MLTKEGIGKCTRPCQSGIAMGQRAIVPHVKIAVVIPALDEADQIAGAIQSARGFDRDPSTGPNTEERGQPVQSASGASRPRVASAYAPPSDSGLAELPQVPQAPQLQQVHVQVLVVDGGSRDETPLLARRAGAEVVSAEPGRAQQLELGWRATTGEAVVFLHADTRLEAGWPEAVASALLDPAVAGGAFRLRFEGEGRLLRLLELGVQGRVRLFGLPYGDQAIFVRRSALEDMGGIPSAELMEDLDLVAEIKSRGRLALLDLHATTSPRRYIEHGPLRTIGRHMLALAAWRLGVDRRRVAAWVHR